MRLLVVTELFPRQNAANVGGFVFDRARALQSLGMSVDVVSLGFTVKGPIAIARRVANRPGPRPALRDSEGQINQFPVTSAAYLSARLRHDPRGIAAQLASGVTGTLGLKEYDAIQAHGMYTLNAGAVAMLLAAQRGLPFAVTLHGSDVNQVMRREPHWHVEVLRRAGTTIFVSDALRRTAIDLGYDGRDAVVIPNGVDIDLFRPRNRASTRQKLGLLPNPRLVTYVGGLTSTKGADRLPEIFRAILMEMPHTQFAIVGDGALSPTIRKGIADLPVTMLGRRTHSAVADVLAASDVIVLPSRSEGWPLVILESQACGTPVVGTDVGGIQEAIGDARLVVGAGLQVEQRLAQLCMRVLRDPPDGDALRARASTFSWGALARLEANALTRLSEV